MPRTKASAKREVEAVVDEGEGKQQEEETEKSSPLSPITKKKKLVKKSSNEKKRKIEEEKEEEEDAAKVALKEDCLLYTSPSPRDRTRSRMPSSA